jgi:leucyl-tRNA synthetase
LLSDANFSNSIAESLRERLQKFYDFVVGIASSRSQHVNRSKTSSRISLTNMDKWVLSTLQNRIMQATEAMEKCQVREAIQQSFFMIDIDLAWYLRRISAGKRVGGSGKPGADSTSLVLTKIAETWTRLLAPFAPHICEEAWEKLGGKGFVSGAAWPAPDKKMIDIEAEEKENYLMSVLDDTKEIIKVTNIKPRKIYYYVSAKWMSEAYRIMLEAALKGESTSVGSLIKESMSKPFARGNERAISKFIQGSYNSTMATIPKSMVERRLKAEFDEGPVLKEAAGFIGKQFSADVKVFAADDKRIEDPGNKASKTQPYRPSIYIES